MLGHLLDDRIVVDSDIVKCNGEGVWRKNTHTHTHVRRGGVHIKIYSVVCGVSIISLYKCIIKINMFYI